jgi:hypothetical protein
MSLQIRRAVLAIATRQERLGPLGGGWLRPFFRGECGEDRCALVLVRLRRDVRELHPEEANGLAPSGR